MDRSLVAQHAGFNGSQRTAFQIVSADNRNICKGYLIQFIDWWKLTLVDNIDLDQHIKDKKETGFYSTVSLPINDAVYLHNT